MNGETMTCGREIVVYLLFPGDVQADSCISGSRILQDENGVVYFANDLQPSGQCVMQWCSELREELPYLQPQMPPPPAGETVHIRALWRRETQEACFLRVILFDRMGRELRRERIRSGDGMIAVPKEAFFWHLQLIHTGTGTLALHHIEIVTAQDETAWNTAGLLHRRPAVKIQNILVPELSRRTSRLPDPAALKMLFNLRTVPLEAATLWAGGTDLSCSRIPREEWKDCERINLIGYGPLSNQTAEELADRIAGQPGTGSKERVFVHRLRNEAALRRFRPDTGAAD